ncbi:hypothetical protein CE91St41_26300 [Oscillospiraceae bacterium]|nr:hypothetical protein CE91St40_11240 [Oscillospiraceae bacterium]BDF75741.1 hypothetical protein CE91St41_26300 [Oscillospiraceae bacterium]
MRPDSGRIILQQAKDATRGEKAHPVIVRRPRGADAAIRFLLGRPGLRWRDSLLAKNPGKKQPGASALDPGSSGGAVQVAGKT